MEVGYKTDPMHSTYPIDDLTHLNSSGQFWGHKIAGHPGDFISTHPSLAGPLSGTIRHFYLHFQPLQCVITNQPPLGLFFNPFPLGKCRMQRIDPGTLPSRGNASNIKKETTIKPAWMTSAVWRARRAGLHNNTGASPSSWVVRKRWASARACAKPVSVRPGQADRTAMIFSRVCLDSA
jgi:hypothetical protein